MYHDLRALLRPFYTLLATALFFQAIAGITSLLPWLALYQWADAQPAGHNGWLAAAAAGGVIWLAAQTLAFHLTHITDARFSYRLRLQLAEKMRNLPLNWFVQQGRSGVDQYVQHDISALHQLVAHAPADIVRLILVPFPAVLLLLLINPLLLILSLLPVCGAFYCFRLTRSGRCRDIFAQRDNALRALSGDYRTLAENPLIAQQFPGRGIVRKTELSLSHFLSVFHQWVIKTGRPAAMAQILLSSVLLAVWLLLCAFVTGQTLSAPALILFILLLRSITEPVAAMGHGADALQAGARAAARISQLLRQPEITCGSGQYDNTDLLPRSVPLEVLNISLHAGEGHTQTSVLRDVSFSLAAGESVAIIGPSGAGKSSLLRLIARFMLPDTGDILLAGRPLSAWSHTGLNQLVTIVMQNSEPLPGTLRDNLLLFNPQASQSQVQHAVTAACFDEVIAAQAKGIDALIGTDVQLSGGEAQRLAIARALIAQSPLLLADEPTSALDPENAGMIFDALLSSPGTRLIVTHDLMLARRADRMLFMADGTIAATGTHEVLMAECAAYREFVMQQEKQHEA